MTKISPRKGPKGYTLLATVKKPKRSNITPTPNKSNSRFYTDTNVTS